VSLTIRQVEAVQLKPIESHFVALVLPKGLGRSRCRPRCVQIQAVVVVVVVEVCLQVQVTHLAESVLRHRTLLAKEPSVHSLALCETVLVAVLTTLTLHQPDSP